MTTVMTIELGRRYTARAGLLRTAVTGPRRRPVPGRDRRSGAGAPARPGQPVRRTPSAKGQCIVPQTFAQQPGPGSAVAADQCPMCGCTAQHQASPTTNAVTGAMQWLAGHYADADVNAAMASATGVSIRQLETLCGRYVGRSPGQLIREVRLERARLALQTTPAKVSEVAVQIGYTRMSRFASDYRQRYGEAPSATRAQARAVRDLLHQPPPRRAGSAPRNAMNQTVPAVGAVPVAPALGAGGCSPGSETPSRVLHLAARFEPASIMRHLAAAHAGLQVTLVSTHPIPLDGDAALPVPDSLSTHTVQDLEDLPSGVGTFDAVVVADRVPVPAVLPVGWLRALAPDGHLLVPLRGLGLLTASRFSGGHAAGFIRDDPGQGVLHLPNDIETETLERLRPHAGTPVPADLAVAARLLDRALAWLKFGFPRLRHHREQHPDRSTTWHLVDQGTGAWARAHLPAARRGVAPTVSQANGSDLWEVLDSWAQAWTWCMDPAHPLEARVAINADGRFAIEVIG